MSFSTSSAARRTRKRRRRCMQCGGEGVGTSGRFSETDSASQHPLPVTTNGTRYEKNGLVCISIWGEPRERGEAYGRLMVEDMRRVREILDFIVYNDYGVKWDFFVRACDKYFCPKIRDQFPEFYEEMEGFAAGCGWRVEEVVAWNNYFTLTESWWSHMPEPERIEVYGAAAAAAGVGAGAPSATREGGGGASTFASRGQQERCTAFMAVGKEWTTDGGIVVAHNNFSNFVDGQLAKYVVDIRPTRGHRMHMIGFPGWIWSGTDFFVTSAGIIGTETTIGGFTAYENNTPIACRIRNAMQYGASLDDYERMLLDGNSGDYANTWLFGDVNKNEIMRLELGLRFHSTERTTNGCFISFNAAYDPRIRNLECVNSGFDDVRRHQGARRVRLAELTDHWKGRIDAEVAKTILGDHYDVYLHKENPCSRTCCSHYDLDAREFMSDPSRPKPFQPRGALDGNVCDSAMARKMTLCLRWGNTCGIPFDKNAFCDAHREWNYLRPFLEDRPQQPWTLFSPRGRGRKSRIFREKSRKKDRRGKRGVGMWN